MSKPRNHRRKNICSAEIDEKENIGNESFILSTKDNSWSNSLTSAPLADTWTKQAIVKLENGEDLCSMSPPKMMKEEEEVGIILGNNSEIKLPQVWSFPEQPPSSSASSKKVVDEDPLRHYEEIEASVRCAFCQLLFESSEKLTSHHQLHHSTKHYTCHCVTCNKWFSNLGEYNLHVDVFHLKFSCTICRNRFTSYEVLKQHEKSHSLVCKICKESFTSIAELNKHTCKICDSLNGSQTSLKTHSKTCHSTSCSVCSAFATHKKIVACRRRTNFTNLKYKCKHCRFRFSSKRRLLVHRMYSHPRLKYVCRICKQEFKTNDELIYHNRKHLTFVCSVCNTRLSSKENLEKHIQTHFGNKCKICSEDFTSARKLFRHVCKNISDVKQSPSENLEECIPTHNDYKCNLCFESFNSNCDLLSHICKSAFKPLQTHSFYNCMTCGIIFQSENALLSHLCQVKFKHIQTHSNANDCKTCGNIFQRESDLLSHTCQVAWKHIPLTDSSYKCQLCLLSFNSTNELASHTCNNVVVQSQSSQTNLETHEEVHLETHEEAHQTYECNTCERSFESKRKLSRHTCRASSFNSRYVFRRVFLKFLCNICDSRFNFLHELKMHSIAHVPLKCLICKLSFKDIHYFDHHCALNLATVVGECRVCREYFKQAKDVVTHYQLKHSTFTCPYCTRTLKSLYGYEQHTAKHIEKLVGLQRKTTQCYTDVTIKEQNPMYSGSEMPTHATLIKDIEKFMHGTRRTDIGPELPMDKTIYKNTDVEIIYESKRRDHEMLVIDESSEVKIPETHKTMNTDMEWAMHTGSIGQHDTTNGTKGQASMYSGLDMLITTPVRDIETLMHDTRPTDIDPKLSMERTMHTDVEIKYGSMQCDRQISVVEESLDVEIPETHKTMTIDVESMHESSNLDFEIPMLGTTNADCKMPADKCRRLNYDISTPQADVEFELPACITTSTIHDKALPVRETTQASLSNSGETDIETVYTTIKKCPLEISVQVNSPLKVLDVQVKNGEAKLDALPNIGKSMQNCPETVQLHNETHAPQVCTVSNLEFNSKELLQDHNISHVIKYFCKFCKSHGGKISTDDQGMFFCNVCQRELEPSNVTQKHESPFNFKCPSCSVYCVTAAEMSNHRWDVHLKWRCRKCNKQCDTEDDYKEHINVHDNIFACMFCCDKLDTCQDLLGHTDTNHINHLCFCGLKYLTFDELKSHQSIHLSCEICGKIFENEESLLSHERCEHSTLKYICKLCGAYQVSHPALVSHMSEHKLPLVKSVDKHITLPKKNLRNRRKLYKHKHLLVKGVDRHRPTRLSMKNRRKMPKRKPVVVKSVDPHKILSKKNGRKMPKRKPTLVKSVDPHTVISKKIIPSHPFAIDVCSVCGLLTLDSLRECEFCHAQLATNADLIEQETKHLAIKCQFCDKTFETSAKLANHRWNTHLKWRCHVCGFQCDSGEAYNIHIVEHSMKCVCKTCGQVFMNNEELEEHNQAKHAHLKCYYCGLYFKSLRDVKKHKINRKKLTKCSMCSAKFCTAYELREHVMQEHF